MEDTTVITDDYILLADLSGNVAFSTSHTESDRYLAPYFEWGFFGSKPVADGDPTRTVFLSKLEAIYLREIGLLSVLPMKCTLSGEREHRVYAVYKQLRDNKWVVRSGCQYGGDFLLYPESGPGQQHAPYIVLVVDDHLHAPSGTIISGLVRAAQGAKKQLVIACPRTKKFHLIDRWIPELERMNKNG